MMDSQSTGQERRREDIEKSLNTFPVDQNNKSASLLERSDPISYYPFSVYQFV